MPSLCWGLVRGRKSVPPMELCPSFWISCTDFFFVYSGVIGCLPSLVVYSECPKIAYIYILEPSFSPPSLLCQGPPLFFFIDALKNKMFIDFFGNAIIWVQACDIYIYCKRVLGLYYVVQATMEFIIRPSLVSNSWQSSCLSPDTEITGMSHYIWQAFFLYCFLLSSNSVI